jgi:FixJ family two-component response regulator
VTPTSVVSIVEDDESVREAIENLIRSIGWDVASFDCADAFLRSGMARNTRLLISDVTMPGMSGIEMHAQLASEGIAPPTIFITGYPNVQDEAVALANGAIAYLEKPLDSNVILARIRHAVGKP